MNVLNDVNIIEACQILTESPFQIVSNDVWENEFSAIDKLIKISNKIILFRHISIDQDAKSSVLSMKRMIESKYHGKQVYISSEHKDFPDLTKSDLVIILDVGATERLAGTYSGTPTTVRIDHHLAGMKCDVTIEDAQAGSTCELLTIFFKGYDYDIDLMTGELLFKGIIADTGRMQYALGKTTLLALGILSDMGVDYKSIYSKLYMRTPSAIKAKSYILNNYLVTPNGMAYLVMDRKKALGAGVDLNDISSMTHELENIKGSPIWMIAIARPDGIFCRLRSRGIDIREIAIKYGGGGHENACGIKLKSRSDLAALIDDCDSAIAKVKNKIRITEAAEEQEKPDYEKKYDEYLEQHISGVQQAYEHLKQIYPDLFANVDLGILDEQIKHHDESKYSEEEYEPYALYYYVSKEKYSGIFDRAWLHHQNANPHHWQYWILLDEDNPNKLTPQVMDLNYIIEMICDWWSFSFNKGNLGEILNYYETNKDKIVFHPETKKQVENILAKIKEALMAQTQNIKEDFELKYKEARKTKYLFTDSTKVPVGSARAYYNKQEKTYAIGLYAGEKIDEASVKQFEDLINSTNYENILLTADTHFGNPDKGCPVAEVVNKLNAQTNDDTIIILLGDICDFDTPERNLATFKAFLNNLKCKKVGLVLGNNETLTIDQYRSLPLLAVGLKFETPEFLFTHVASQRTDKINIHGHTHGTMHLYKASPKRKIDIGYALNTNNQLKKRDIYSLADAISYIPYYEKNAKKENKMMIVRYVVRESNEPDFEVEILE